MEPSALSLLPPAVLIALAIATRRILLSLIIGIALGALLYNQWNPLDSVALVAGIMRELIYAEGTVTEEIYILAFVMLLGVLTSFIYVSGGLHAFSRAAVRRVRTRFQAKLVPIITGLIIFFDDAFSSLVGGNVSRPITDQHRISRAKLSYLVDSVAAPVIILTPISGWAVFIAATMSGILESNDVAEYSGYQAYLLSVPSNFYAITSLLFVFAVAYFGFNFGPMRHHERRAVEDGILVDRSRDVPGEADQNLPVRDDGRVADLVVPVLTLIGVTVVGTVWIGVAKTSGGITPMQVLANTDVILALFFGGIISCLLAAGRLLMRRTPASQVTKAGLSGARSMLIAVAVLFLAWTTAELMSLLGIGEYLAGLVNNTLLFVLLPMLIFIVGSFISFAIGSTFGTFGILLPIAAEIAISVDQGLLIPMFGAVLAGAIFGDHTSPLSDTTILSSIGSGIQLIDHVTTQLPYALVCAAASAVGYVALGLTKNIGVGLLVTLVALGIAVLALRVRMGPESARSAELGTAE